MRGVAAIVVLCAGVAHADEAGDLVAKGEAFARDGRYSQAIDAFKAADRIAPAARHPCLIALAYIRRELWPQAEIFLARCHQRATLADPLPDWVEKADVQIAERLAAAKIAPVEIQTRPASTVLSVSSFAPDETFAPRAIHLAPGRHVVVASAPGYSTAQAVIEIRDGTPQHVAIELSPIKPPPVAPVAWVTMGAGGAILLTGVALHAFYYKPQRDRLDDAPDRPTYLAASDEFDKRRKITLAVYGAGVLTLAAGIVLHYTVFREARVDVEPRDGGAIVSVAW